MRAPKKYVARNGEVTYRVRYLTANGQQTSETFYEEADAVEFSRLVATLGAPRAVEYITKRTLQEFGSSVGDLTVDELFERWIAHKSRRDKHGKLRDVRSERTLLDYRRMYRSRIQPAFGHIPTTFVTAIEVQNWVDKLGEEIEPKTIADYHSLLHGMFKWGLQPSRALLTNDPCTETELPKRHKKPPKGLRPAEWQILHAAAKQVDADAADLLLFLTATGWRWSEAVAARVSDVDWDGRHVYVSMGRVRRREGNHFEYVEDAKSAAGMGRRVKIVGEAAEMVMRRIYGKGPGDLILTTGAGGHWHYTSFHQRYWTRPAEGNRDYAPKRTRILEVAKEMGLDRPDLTPHWLRHTMVFMMILAGEGIPAIQHRAGHDSAMTTMDVYGRMTADTSDDALDLMAVMLSGTVKREIESRL